MVACVSAEAKAKVAVTTIDDAPTKDMEPVLLDFQTVQDGWIKKCFGDQNHEIWGFTLW